MAALSEIIPCPSSVLALETVAARRAVHFLQELNLRGSILEVWKEFVPPDIYKAGFIAISVTKELDFGNDSFSQLFSIF
uniref:Uncharacterized protein n=1 Tax=Quercus lobata TaxID=97700 RepID=A0A7N2N1A5_QUELO